MHDYGRRFHLSRGLSPREPVLECVSFGGDWYVSYDYPIWTSYIVLPNPKDTHK
jgi:hypothetical protein